MRIAGIPHAWLRCVYSVARPSSSRWLVEVTLNQVDAVVVVDGDVHDRDAPVDALRVQRTLTARHLVATQRDDQSGGGHDRSPLLG